MATLREHGIVLPDVVVEAHRQGSLDSAIRNRNEKQMATSTSSNGVESKTCLTYSARTQPVNFSQ